MAQHPNVARIRAGYAAFSAGDLATVLELFSPDLAFHVAGSGPMAGVHKGREGIAAVIGHTMELSGATQHFEVHHVFADAEHGVVHVRETARRAADGVALDVAEVHLVAFDDDGLIREFWDMPADPDVHDAFFEGR